MKQQICILGSTGSIGTQALDVIREHGDRYEAYALTANSRWELLVRQAREFHPAAVVIANDAYYEPLKEALADTDVKVYAGQQALNEIVEAEPIHMVLTAMVGFAGLSPTIHAIKARKKICLANKETLVVAGELICQLANEYHTPILPVDSEHSAIFQCLQGNKKEQLKSIILTASGGPFYKKTKADLRNVGVQQALAHPNWSMGRKITIDSATLMNKGLEFIEAIWLFDLKPEQIEIVVQRESVVHSAVEFNDNSVIAQLGVPDMKIPIQYALLYPERVDCPTKHLSLTDYGTLSFDKPDYETFDCLTACIKAITQGGTKPAIVNGANEVAVAAFLDGKIKFLEIGELVTEALENIDGKDITCVDDVLEADNTAREYVRKLIIEREK